MNMGLITELYSQGKSISEIEKFLHLKCTWKNPATGEPQRCDIKQALIDGLMEFEKVK